MVFNSPLFLFVFLPLAFLLYLPLRNRPARDWLLCVASLLFYALGGLRLLPLLVISALWAWGMGLLLGRPGRRRLCCALGVGAELLLLCVYKYLDFFLTALGLPEAAPGLALPIGISFFTFQGISYLVDVYRDPASAAKNPLWVLLQLALFPRLLAGPLVSWREGRGQLLSHPWDAELAAGGLRRFALGLAKKLLLAEALGKVVAGVYALEGEALCAPLAWLGALCYCLQIYYDFSGYSDMAIGLGALFGYRFPENFNYPYVSRSLTEFWRRWHMTLNRWFVDYLYIPLGGSRRGRGRTVLNKLLVFLFTGLWHGAGWTFLLWGLWHGVFVALEGLLSPLLRRLETRRAGRLALRVYTLLVVLLGFVLFRAESLSQGLTMISRLFSHFALTQTGLLAAQTLLSPARWLALILGLVFCLPVLPRLREKLPARALPPLQDVGALLLLALSALAMAGGGFSPFIYFQF